MSQPILAICVATYRRGPLLRKLLQSLTEAERPAGLRLELRVVDNDPLRSAQAITWEAFAFFDRLLYDCVPERNLSAVRNRALDFGPARWVAFVDDDEQVDPRWLVELLAAQRESGADAVFGPVERQLPEDAPAWIERGRFFACDAPPQPLPWTRARTGNALVRGSWFYDEGLRFDPAYGTTGGEDSELFARLQARGGRLAWAPRARVWEPVSPNRLRCGWLLQRAYWGGVQIQRLRRHDPRAWIPAPLRAAGRIARGTATCLRGAPALLRGRPETLVQGLQHCALAVGGFAAWVAPARATRREAYPCEPAGSQGSAGGAP